MTQRDDMGREVGRGFRVGNSCTPVVDSCQCMAKPMQYCKVKELKKIILLEHIEDIYSQESDCMDLCARLSTRWLCDIE